MPELPEVETIKRCLAEKIRGSKVLGVEIRLEKIIACPSLQEFKDLILGKMITDLGRRGKFLLFHLDGRLTMAVHLRMSGSLIVAESESPRPKHTHVIFLLSGARELRFINPRQFGRIYLYTPETETQTGLLCELGPEPLEQDFTLEDFRELFDGRKARIKSLLLDQRFLAGLGNIYVDEALFLSGIDPERRAHELTGRELEGLLFKIRRVLREGIRYRGTTRRDYVDADGTAGEYQNHLRVYDREGRECLVCSGRILRKKVAGRSTFFCPNCQPPGGERREK